MNGCEKLRKSPQECETIARKIVNNKYNFFCFSLVVWGKWDNIRIVWAGKLRKNTPKIKNSVEF